MLRKPVEQLGAVRVNFFCCVFGLALVAVPLLISGHGLPKPNFPHSGLLIVSGVLGVGIAETMILRSIRMLGALNVVLFLGIQPLLIELGLHHTSPSFSTGLLLAVVVVPVMLIRSFRGELRMGWQQLLLILAAVLLDSVALVLWKRSFSDGSTVSPEESALIRYGVGVMFILMMGALPGSFEAPKRKTSVFSNASLWIAGASLGIIVASILFSYGLSQVSPVSATCLALLIPAVIVVMRRTTASATAPQPERISCEAQALRFGTSG